MPKRPSPPSAEWSAHEVNVKGSLEEEINAIVRMLEPHGYEIKIDDRSQRSRIEKYRVMMFRHAHSQWTQGYCNKEKDRIRFTGPEVGALVGQHLQPSNIKRVDAFQAEDGTLHTSPEAALQHTRQKDVDLAMRELENYFINHYKDRIQALVRPGDETEKPQDRVVITPYELAQRIAKDRYLLPVFRRIYGE